MLSVHAVAFGIYLIVAISTIISQVMYEFGNDAEIKLKLSAITGIATNFISQIPLVCLCYIFWQMATKKEREPTETTFGEVEVLETDMSFEFQAELWNQFMRSSVSTGEVG